MRQVLRIIEDQVKLRLEACVHQILHARGSIHDGPSKYGRHWVARTLAT